MQGDFVDYKKFEQDFMNLVFITVIIVFMEGWAPIDMGLNTASQSSEWKEVSQEDMIRVTESSQKAAQMWAQIRWDSQKNGQIAKFLEFLFSEVKDDKIREIIVELCSKADSWWFGMTLSINELALFFEPFFQHQFQEYWLKDVFPHEVPAVSPVNIDNYITYIRDIRQYYPLIQQMDSDTVSSLIVALIGYFGYGSVSEEKLPEVIDAVKAKLS